MSFQSLSVLFYENSTDCLKLGCSYQIRRECLPLVESVENAAFQITLFEKIWRRPFSQKQ